MSAKRDSYLRAIGPRLGAAGLGIAIGGAIMVWFIAALWVWIVGGLALVVLGFVLFWAGSSEVSE